MSVTVMLSVDKGDPRFNYRRKKLRLRPASFLSCVRRVKSAFGDQNTKLQRLAFLRLHLSNATFSSARATPLYKVTRPASLQQNVRLRKSAFLKCRKPDATISNARSASLLSRGIRPAFPSQNVRAASVLQDVSSTFLTPAPQNYDASTALGS